MATISREECLTQQQLFSAADENPRRLSDETHVLAHRFLSGEFGRAMETADFSLGEQETTGLSENMKYGLATRLVAQNAPLRILPGERIVGATTLREATWHQVPLMQIASVSHTTIGFDRALKLGLKTYRVDIERQLAKGNLDEQGVDFLQAMLLCIEGMDIWRQRHIQALDKLIAEGGDEAEHWGKIRAALKNVPTEAPRTFHEAVQSLWFFWDFQRLMGNWSGLGRVDEMLWPYLEADLTAGRIDLDEAREILAHFWLKGTEWTGASDFAGSGDAQYYQNVVLAGVNADGVEIANDVTRLIMEVVEELHISDFPIAVRLSANSPEWLIRKVAEVQRHGGGIIAVYNEDIVIKGLVRFGYEEREARTFANDGCWEVLIPGKTTFGYSPFDILSLLQETLGLTNPDTAKPDYATFDDLYQAFHQRLTQFMKSWHDGADGAWMGGAPTPLLSILLEGCIEKGRGYYERGPKYCVLAPHAGGMANLANSLHAIKQFVFDTEQISLDKFIEILRADWEGYEDLRRTVLNTCPMYGNDDPAADAMMERVFIDYTDLVWQVRDRSGVKRPAGISTFGREIAWTEGDQKRTASPDGHHAAEYLATNFSPSPGTDRQGPTAVVKSYCKMDLTRVPNGATLELKMFPGSLRGEEGLTALMGLLRTFVELGGMFMQVDVVDTDLLLEAQAHPEKYPNLAVRISGWSARFATLNKQWQDMIIKRTQQVV